MDRQSAKLASFWARTRSITLPLISANPRAEAEALSAEARRKASPNSCARLYAAIIGSSGEAVVVTSAGAAAAGFGASTGLLSCTDLLGSDFAGSADFVSGDFDAPDLGASDLGASDLGASDLGASDLGASDLAVSAARSTGSMTFSAAAAAFAATSLVAAT